MAKAGDRRHITNPGINAGVKIPGFNAALAMKLIHFRCT
jgi:hypothetical protein